MVYSLPGNAQADSFSSVSQHKLQQLARDPQWLNLLHYKQSQSGARGQSYVDDVRFFLSADGKHDALAELQATLQAFYVTPQVSQCQFVARRQWLLEQIPELTTNLPEVKCQAYQEWRGKLKTQRVVLVFASSYLNSPSSMYGHTFLRFDPEGIDQGAPLLSYALNFGAITGENDNGMLYAYRGLVGGYPGLFSAQPYYEKVKEYSRMDNRDLWEYQLNLNDSEIDRMLAHIWELDKINFQYFFFDENCSFRLMELLDVARPGHRLAAQFPLVAIPIDTIRAADQAGMIADVIYRPSNRTKLTDKINQLSSQQQQMALQLAGDINVLSSREFASVAADIQRNIIDVAYSLLRDENNHEARDSTVAKRRFQLLKALNQRSDAAVVETEEASLSRAKLLPPETGHKTGLVGLVTGFEEGVGRGKNAGFVDLEGRIAYHDLLDNIAGYPKDTSLNMGRLVVRLKEGESPQLQRFDLLEITSLSARTAFFKPLSWQVNAGWERQWTEGKDELVAQVNGGAGWTRETLMGGRLFALLKGRLEYNPGFEQNLDIAAGFLAGAFWQQASGNLMIQAEYLDFADGADRSTFQAQYNYVLAENSALRIHFKRTLNDSTGVNEAGVSYRYYY
ncbi:DUF4105 domain-containing protein [Maricurvus nonylphenolicus]|uniref:Lnb N-terminal periplasmic domain-containing protein n=1 Tax=Maricurvus nonylphenolicus TaxID=1008307 RepID=UPI0036F3E264